MGPNKLIMSSVERRATWTRSRCLATRPRSRPSRVDFEGPVGLSQVSDTLRPERAAENVFGPKLKTEKPPPFKA